MNKSLVTFYQQFDIFQILYFDCLSIYEAAKTILPEIVRELQSSMITNVSHHLTFPLKRLLQHPHLFHTSFTNNAAFKIPLVAKNFAASLGLEFFFYFLFL